MTKPAGSTPEGVPMKNKLTRGEPASALYSTGNNKGRKTMEIKLAEALLRRKELQQKVDQLARVKESDMASLKVQRVKVTDSLDDLKALVPRVTMRQVTANYDWHARQLRLVDAAIQQANWTTEISVDDSVMADFEENLQTMPDDRI